ncbi:hypothetical protein RJ639_038253 [Escallonia herrerae]|uniref:Retrovirus-related Pol polyprotein from transposon TNT 1-94 n=1 Tax=Escallonia herrerae TaxID=1293975 RepID=A0AA88WL15_9ASTE|nr:hypothetical protein RJ639_038253 [Escallonia herrerae]
MQVEDYLYQKDLYLPLVGEKPEAMNASEWAILDRKALATGKKSYNRKIKIKRQVEVQRETIVCWNCNKEGHKKNDCTELKKKKGAGGRQGDDEGANMVSSNERTYDDLCLSATVDDNFKVWYVDSGASIHCTPHRNCFCDYVHGDYGHVTVRNGYRCSIVGKGKVEIKLSNGGTLVLKDVRHIPELQKNLISVSGLDREGYFVAFGEKQWKVTKGSMVVARGERVGTLYILSDDVSRKTWIYAIRQKSDVYHTFKKWKVLVENETGNKVKCLKSDNGGEYHDEGFQEYCSNNGIRLIRTVKRTPQENGLAERMNRTIMERARCTRIHADLPLQFWAAAVDTAVYLINKSLASALNGGIPEEEWSGKPVNYSFLRVFGCIAYAHIDKEERKKLDSKSQKCVFIRYGGDEYSYRLWDYEHNKIIKSRNVIFNESRLYKHRLQEHGIEKDNREYMELDEPEDGQVPRTENPEVLDKTTDTEIGAGDQQQVPETLNLRRSSRVRKAPDRLYDMLVAGSSMGRINELKKKLANTFSMKDLGEAKQLLGMRITRDRKHKKLWLSQEEYIEKSAIHLAKNSAFHSRTKHIQLRYHFIWSLLKDGQLNLENIEGNKNPADMLTKVVDRQKLSLCSTLISLR